jgi:glycosyltransferase involved in cell wall biosynthesis
MKEPRIFLGVVEIAGYLQNLFLGFRKLGYDAAYLNVNAFSFNYDAYLAENYRFLNFFISIAKKANTARGIGRFFYKAIYWVLKFIVFIWCLFRFDVFIFCAGSSFFWFFDYKLLKFFNKKIIYVSLGSDSRPAYMNGSYKDDSTNGTFDPSIVVNRSKQTWKRIKTIEKYADILINYPQHGHFHSRPFISGNFIGFPTRLSDSVRLEQQANMKAVRILHAPTRPKAKGSLVFRELIAELISEGLEIDYVEITGKSNHEVLEEIKRADLVLDELFSDLPLGGLGSEAACMGKPVVVGGWFADKMNQRLKVSETPPSFYCLPSDIKETLRKLVADPVLRQNAGKQLRGFLEEQWAEKQVASKYLQLINDSYPRHWVYFPEDIEYLEGWGISQEELEDNIRSLVSAFGPDALSLTHNPVLLDKFLSLVQEKDA